MRKEYDFSAARKNPHAAQLKKQITIRLDEESISYFKSISDGCRYSVSKPHQPVFTGLRGHASQAGPQLEVGLGLSALLN
jgi:hypothetical protein